MRVAVDREAGTVRLLAGQAVEERRISDGVTELVDAAGRLVGVELRDVASADLDSITVELAGRASEPTVAVPMRSAPPLPPLAAATPAYDGPLVWEPEAEAAALQVPFFSRGRHRLAASALARRRGLDRVTVEIVRMVAR